MQSSNISKPGAGIFKFDSRLILTEEGKSKSNWQLPSSFHPNNVVKIEYLPSSVWSIPQNDIVQLRARGRGQEFVVSEDKENQVIDWAVGLINKVEVEA